MMHRVHSSVDRRGQTMRDAVDRHETDAAPLESFPAIFSQAMSLGLLSKRRVYHEATQLLQKQSGTLKALTGAHLQCMEAECPAELHRSCLAPITWHTMMLVGHSIFLCCMLLAWCQMVV